MAQTKIVIIGATSLIAEHCARLWAQQAGCELVLVGRNVEKLTEIASDLKVRSPESILDTHVTDFSDPEIIRDFVCEVCSQKLPDIVLVAHGYLPDQDACQKEPAVTKEVLEVNAISPVLFAEAFASQMESRNKGAIAIISSVAGDRGRKSNYVYGAAKGLVSRYAQGMQHRFAGTGISVTLVKPGPTNTPMTASLHDKGLKLAPVEDVAKAIVNGVSRRKKVIYTPAKWLLIMLIIRHLPAFIFNKMNI